jgi:hypothetical protein
MLCEALCAFNPTPLRDEVLQGPARHRGVQARRAGIQLGLSGHGITLCPIIASCKFIQKQHPVGHIFAPSLSVKTRYIIPACTLSSNPNTHY